MDNEYPPAYIKEQPEVLDRFIFDYLFKRLLADGYDQEEAKDIIMYNCTLSLIVMQERFDNGYYLEMTTESGMAPDLLNLYQEERKKKIRKN